MSINKKLNKDFFSVKKKHQLQKKNKLTFLKVIRNIFITFLLIYLFNIFRNVLSERIEKNKSNDVDKELLNTSCQSQQNDLKLTAKKYEIIEENGQKYYVGTIILENKSNKKIEYFSWSCSWYWLYVIDNKNVKIKGSPCDKNFLIVKTILPNEIRKSKIKLFIDEKDIKIKKIRIGFNFIDAKNKNRDDFFTQKVNLNKIIWSNRISL